MRLEVDIRKKLGNFLLEVNFAIDNDFLAILGASGSGKTMTLKCIAGVETPDEGRIVLGDRVLFDSSKGINVPARKRKIGFLFQDYALFPNMTVRENIAVAARDNDQVDQMIRRMELESVENLKPNQISGGQSQRTAIARMLITEPEIIMLDEPFSALDNYLKYRIEQEIYDVTISFQGPVIMVSHDRNEVYRLANRIGIMEQGSLIDVQAKKDFFEDPKSVTATRLTGCKNISKIVKKDDMYYAEDWGINITIPECEITPNYVGYRAHYFELVEKDEKCDVLRCRVTRVIEDTFSVNICLRQVDNSCRSHDSLLTWIVSKDKWQKLKDEVQNKEFFLKLDCSKLIVLER